MAFPESFIQELKMRNSITEVVAPYVSLKRNGRNMVGLCPFHGEKTPSFNIYDENTDNAHFYCFGCGVGGDVISFVMRIENLDYVDAVKLLAQRAGMDLPETGYDDSMSRLRKRIFEANREAARFYYKSLYQPVGREGLNYLHGRMLTDRTIRHFGLGFADDDWSSLTKHLKSLGFSEHAANLAVQRRSGNGVFDRFTNRVMFPIIDLRGNVIAFGGRIMTDQKPKYLNTSDTPVFKKSENLFSLNNAKNAGTRTLLLCEGYMDVIAVSQAGFSNAVATLGTDARHGAHARAGDADEALRRRGDHLLRRRRGRTKGDLTRDPDFARRRLAGQGADDPQRQGPRRVYQVAGRRRTGGVSGDHRKERKRHGLPSAKAPRRL